MFSKTKEFFSVIAAYGDGIGPEIMEAVLYVLKEARAPLHIQMVDIGKDQYEKGHTTGIPEPAWNILLHNAVLLKSPITTPQGKGYKSINVTLRRALGLYANIRPCVTYVPFVKSHHPKMDVVIIRENEEDLYSGVEYRQTANVYQSLKWISRTGCENIITYAFEYALLHGRKKVTCFTKDNIMKMTDGTFHTLFDEIGRNYPSIEKEHMIVDIGTARLASRPEVFDVIVTLNLYGDIISDVAADISGSVGLAGSANIGKNFAMFEAIHGSAPDIAGKDMANPSGLLQAAIMMLVHLGCKEHAEKIHNAWLSTLEDGMHTGDIYNASTSKEKVGTRRFGEEIVARLGKIPQTLPRASYSTTEPVKKLHEAVQGEVKIRPKKELVGVDIFLDAYSYTPRALAEKIQSLTSGRLKLQMITIRGLKLWPDGKGTCIPEEDHFCCRFMAEGFPKRAEQKDIGILFDIITQAGLEIIKTENLYLFDDALGFTLAQGE